MKISNRFLYYLASLNTICFVGDIMLKNYPVAAFNFIAAFSAWFVASTNDLDESEY